MSSRAWPAIVLATCWIAVSIVFILSAVANAMRRPDPTRGRLRTLLSSLAVSWRELIVLVVVVIGLSAIPQRVWNVIDMRDPVIKLLGAAVLIAGTLLVVWTRLALGAMWSSSARVRSDHELRTGGPYRIARHPMYTGFGGMLLGAGLLTASLRIVAFAILLVLVLYVRSRAEERLMIQTFGDQYLEYRSQVGALLPTPWRRHRNHI
jgi:protein-S-isoprenylcysteine O-methyltransferase Ste14